MVTVRRYGQKDKPAWDSFNEKSKNHLFMFNRNYMDYHSDRFKDHSLMFFDEESLIALLPMNEKDNTLFSHGGLTFGGFITDNHMKQHIMNECFEELIQYARKNGFIKINYKVIPHFYHLQPAEEDKFALFLNGANLSSVDVSTVIDLAKPLKMPKGRKAQISRARREGVEIIELSDSDSFNQFLVLEERILSKRHDVHCVHTGSEMKMLHDCFPENIHLFAAMKEKKMIGGTIVYEYDEVIHTQYMAADDEARKIGALDLAISYVIDKYQNSKRWLDFGISTEHGKVYLNEGLCAQKESFGGRTFTYENWIVNI